MLDCKDKLTQFNLTLIAYRTILYLLGILLSIIALAMLIPCVVEGFVYKTKGWEEFLFGAFLTGSIGSLLAIANRSHEKIELRVREAFLLTASAWIVTPIFAALPIYWSNLDLSFIDSWFESVSALTTTGATIITRLERAPTGVLLWRSILQWLGGTGIILMAMIILPTLKIGGMQLFRSEFSDKSEKILPRVSQITTAITSTYIFLTIACFFALYTAGLTPFDSVCHAMATVSTGGLSTKSASIAAYKSLPVELITMFFMLLGGITFILYIRLWQGNWKAVVNDSQVRTFLGVILFFTLILSLWNWVQAGMNPGKSLRDSAFTVISIATTTGYTTADYTKWGAFPAMLILFLSTIGGCTGSTAGGIKIFRIQVLAKETLSHLRQLRRPHGVYVPLFQNQKIPETVVTSVLTFVTLYFCSIFCLSVLLTMFGMDLLNSLSASISSISNTGPGITESLGPASTHAPLARGAKLLLMFGMIAGRLELLTIFVLLMPGFWKR